MKARVHVAGAVEDQSFTDEMKDRLDERGSSERQTNTPSTIFP